jgi:hypothetical protein
MIVKNCDFSGKAGLLLPFEFLEGSNPLAHKL